MKKLNEWYHDRQKTFGAHSPQALPLALSVYQDEILAIEIVVMEVSQIDEGLPRISQGNTKYNFPKKYGVQQSDKADEIIQFGQRASAIGASYDTKDIRQISCASVPGTIDKYSGMVRSTLAKTGKLMVRKEMETGGRISHV